MAKKTARQPEKTGTPFDRQPPCNVEAERGVLGALLLDPRLCDDVAVIARPNDFYLDQHRRIYRQLLEMNAESTGIDLTLLVEKLRASGELVEIGGEAYLAELMNSVQVTAHAIHYAKIVQQNSLRRQLIETCEKSLNEAYAPEIPPKELVARAEERIFAVSEDRMGNNLASMRDLMPLVSELIEKRQSGVADGVSTGFGDLDAMIGGLHGSELVILAARPSMGKTALAANIADSVAVEQRAPVLFFSLEMAKTELAVRFLCARGRIAGDRMRGNLTKSDMDKFHLAASQLDASPLYIDDTPSRTVTEISAIARRLKRQQGLGLVVVDYLGLIEPDNPLDPRQEQVAKIARRLKGLARELDVPVLCLSQLNRQAEQSKDNRPRLSHLRESGAIEQDADVVMFVHREEYYHSKEEAEAKNLLGKADVIVAKQRNGPVGDVRLAWYGKYTLFCGYMNADQEEFDDQFSVDFAQYDDSGM